MNQRIEKRVRSPVCLFVCLLLAVIYTFLALAYSSSWLSLRVVRTDESCVVSFSLPFFVFWSNVVLQTSSCLNKVLISACRCHCGYEFLLLFRCWWLSLCLVGWLLSKIKCYLDCRFGATFPKARPSSPTIDSFGPSIHPSVHQLTQLS